MMQMKIVQKQVITQMVNKPIVTLWFIAGI